MQVLCLASILQAQTGTSAIAGLITDQTAAPIPNAAVKIINEDSGTTLSTRTNPAGAYRIASLPPGAYRLEAGAPGFGPVVRTHLLVAVSQVLAVDLELQLGQAAETVTVEAVSPLIETQSSSAGQLVDRKMVANLPMPNRAATALAALAPGVVMINSGTGAENYPLFTVAGGRARNQNFTLDGGNVTNAVGLTRPQQMTSLPVDAMQEFRVISNNYSAEYGHSTGGVITLSTRSGTNQFHGSVFDFIRNDALDARNFFSAEKPPLRLQQFGLALGGPIRKDKTHFFASWEQTREVTSTTVLSTVPNLAQREGDFSGLRTASGAPVLIFDPATTAGRDRAAFPSNIIPAARFDPVARAALAFWPLPNRAGTSTGANNFAGTNDAHLDRSIVVARLDHQIRSAGQVSVRYYINNAAIDNRGSYRIPVSDPDAGTNDVRIQSLLVGHTHAFRPSLLNELKVSYLQRKFLDRRYGLNTNAAASLGLAGVSGTAFPSFVLPGYASLGTSVAAGSSVFRIQTPIRDTQVLEALSWNLGKHAFKFGVEHRRGFNNEQRDRSSSGNFGFTPLITGLPGTPGTGDALAAFLLGEVNSAAVQVSDVISSRAAYWAGFAQDDWRIAARLTLNYGLRWEAELPRRVDFGRMNSFDPAAINPVSGTPGVVTIAGRNGVSRQAFPTRWNNLGPRLGCAWQPVAGTTIRGGAGIFFGPTVSNSIGDAATLGFATSASFVVPQADLQSATRLRQGVPPYQRPPLDAGLGAVPPTAKPNTAVTYFAPGRPTPVSYQYNLAVQRELRPGLLFELGYLANISHHLTANDLTINQVPPALMGPGDAQARRPFPQFSNVSLINPAIGNSTYHAAYLKTERRFSRGLSVLAHYTFSKFIDDVPSSVEYGDASSYMDAYNRRLDKGLSGSDAPHRLVAAVLYEVPAFRSNRLVHALSGGWNAGVLGTFQSGEPFTVVSLANTTNAFPAGALRPDIAAPAQLPSGARSLFRWFDTSAFRAPQAFRFGNSPRNGLRGPGQQTIDLTLARQFRLTERYRADIRGELYNLLNRANFDAPGGVFGSAGFGVISSARPARAVQLGLRVSF